MKNQRNNHVCYRCGVSRDVRPYGPNAAMVCLPCVDSDPALEAVVKQQFISQLDAAAAYTGAAISCDYGPVPYGADKDDLS